MVLSNRLNLPDRLHDVIRPLQSVHDAIEPILDMVGDARIVMIGEASHGTQEFYDYRAEITKRLITDRGFTACRGEADWPDAWRMNRFARGFNDDGNAAEALAGFKRFPQWMWRNTVVLDFIDWLRSHNNSLATSQPRADFTGIDLYSLGSSMRAVLEYLDKNDPEAASGPLSLFVLRGFRRRPAGVRLRGELRPRRVLRAKSRRAARRAAQPARRSTRNATAASPRTNISTPSRTPALVANAEEYYRDDVPGLVHTWNLRDEHMADTIDALIAIPGPHRPAGRRPRSSSGRTTRTSATPAPPKWASAASGTSGSSCASAGATRRATSASALIPAPSPPPTTGTSRPGPSASAPA